MKKYLICLLGFALSCQWMPAHKNSSGTGQCKDKSALACLDQLKNLDNQIPKLDVEKVVLDNGLTVLLVKNSHLPLFSYYTFFRIGSRHELKGMTGATHFLEHLLFKVESPTRKGIKFDTVIEVNGGHSNAYTNRDQTVYYENLPIKGLEEIIALEAARLKPLTIPLDAFEQERKVILEERKYRYENSPKGRLFLKLTEELFKNTPYETSVIGDIPDLIKVTFDDIKKYHHKFYVPNNAILVIAGDINRSKTLDLIKEHYGPLKARTDFDEIRKIKDDPKLYTYKIPKHVEIKMRGRSRSLIFIKAFKGDALGTDFSYALDILSQILGGGASSYLVQKFVKGDRPKLTSLSSYNYNLKYNGIFYIAGEFLPKTNYKSFKRALARAEAQVCTEAITARSVQKAKNQILIDYFYGLESNSGLAELLGNYENYFANFEHYKVDMEKYKELTLQDVKEACHKIFDKKSVFLSVYEKHPKFQRKVYK